MIIRSGEHSEYVSSSLSSAEDSISSAVNDSEDTIELF